MRGEKRESSGFPFEFTRREPDHYRIPGLHQVAREFPEGAGRWTCDAVSRTIRVLSILAGDENVRMQNPARVIEAFQNHGHLLCDLEVEILRDWLVQLSESRNQGPCRITT